MSKKHLLETDDKFNIIEGHVLDVLKSLPNNKFRTCVSSPPYFALRSYEGDKQIWDADENCTHSWQTHFQKPRGGKSHPDRLPVVGTNNMDKMDLRGIGITSDFCSLCGAWKGALGLEPTPELYVSHLTQVFREVKRTLTDDGTLWVNIGDTYCGTGDKSGYRDPKHKGRNGQSKAINNKLYGYKSKDLIGIPWMLAFSLRNDGWYLRSDIIWEKPNCLPQPVKDRPTKSHEYFFLLSKSRKYYYNAEAIMEDSKNKLRLDGDGKLKVGEIKSALNGKRNKRSVWSVNTQANRLTNYASFPTKLIEPCILAGANTGDWVLDPFNGTGTTGIVALLNKRKYIGIELSSDSVIKTYQRITKEVGF